MAQLFTRTVWDQTHAPSEAELAARLQREGYAPVLLNDPPGWRTPEMYHPYHKTWWVVDGWMHFRIHGERGTEDITLRDGDRLDLVPNTVYEIEVAGAGCAVSFQVTPFALPPVHGVTRAGEGVGPWPEPGK